jgi:hypothetical protein
MEQAKLVAYKITDTFWTCNLDPNVVYGIRLYNRQPFVNFDYPYQLIISVYSQGPAFLANTTQIRGGVHIGGSISYGSESWFGTLSEDGKTISWKGTIGGKPVIWEAVSSIPSIKGSNDQYSSQSIHALNTNSTNFINSRLDTVYPTTFNP